MEKEKTIWDGPEAPDFSKPINIFIVHSLSLKNEAIELEKKLKKEYMEEYSNCICYIPGRDTPQKEVETILACNLRAMQRADRVFVVWNGLSYGTLFDMGMAYSLRIPIFIHALKNDLSWQSYFKANEGRYLHPGYLDEVKK